MCTKSVTDIFPDRKYSNVSGGASEVSQRQMTRSTFSLKTELFVLMSDAYRAGCYTRVGHKMAAKQVKGCWHVKEEGFRSQRVKDGRRSNSHAVQTTWRNIFMFSFKEVKVIVDQNVLFFHDEGGESRETSQTGCSKPKVFLQNVLWFWLWCPVRNKPFGLHITFIVLF